MPCQGECNLSNLKPDVPCIEDFVASKIPRVAPFHVMIFRILVAVNCAVVATLSIVSWGQWTWPVFLTNINYSLVVLYFIIASLSSIINYSLCKGRKSSLRVDNNYLEQNGNEDATQNNKSAQATGKEIFTLYAVDIKPCCTPESLKENDKDIIPGSKFLYQIQLFLFTTVLNMTITVVFGFWFLLGGIMIPFGKGLSAYLNLESHGLVMLYVIIEFSLNRIRLRVLHFVYPVILGAIYCVMVVVVWHQTGFAPYKILDFGEHTGMAIGCTVGVTFVVTPLFHFLWYGLQLLFYRLLRL